jgi:hypothetical protein
VEQGVSTPTDDGAPSGPARGQGSLVLIGFSVGVLILFAVMLNNPDKVAEWGSKLFGWQTPKQECIANLKQIDGAVQQWVLENKKTATDTYSLTDTNLLDYFRGSVLPSCPLGGTYSGAASVSGCPLCTVPGHTL